jgi:hypothetical protein
VESPAIEIVILGSRAVDYTVEDRLAGGTAATLEAIPTKQDEHVITGKEWLAVPNPRDWR